MSIDWDKPVQTRDGREVRIYTREGADADRPVVGEVKLSGGTWSVNRWLLSGADPQARTGLHLVNVTQQHTVWVNVSKLETGDISYFCHESCDEADEMATKLVRRIARFEHTFTEGEGLRDSP